MGRISDANNRSAAIERDVRRNLRKLFEKRKNPRINKAKVIKSVTSTRSKNKTMKDSADIERQRLLWKSRFAGNKGVRRPRMMISQERLSITENIKAMSYADTLKGGFFNDAMKNKKPRYMTKIVKSEDFIKKLRDEYPFAVTQSASGGKLRMGSYPAPLGIDTIFNLTLNKTSDAKEIFEAVPYLIRKIGNMMRRLPNIIQKRARFYIYTLVPEDSGDLRESLYDSLSISESTVPLKNSTSTKYLQVHIRYFSELPYAGIANIMPSSSLRHPPNRRKSQKGRNPLYDPAATSNFFYLTKMKIKMIATEELKHFFGRIQAMVRSDLKLKGTTYAMIRKLFTIEGLGRGAV